jgi:hypothetical protein
MMLWRKNKSDAANDARIQVQQVCFTYTPIQVILFRSF